MNDLTIIKIPDTRLTQKCEPVGIIGKEMVDVVYQMFKLMGANGGAGLAAPQVGLNIRLFITSPDRIYFDPEISELQGEATDTEVCLSIPNRVCRVKRATSLRIKAKDIDGKAIDKVVTGWDARVIQHEYDHLEGILITDK